MNNLILLACFSLLPMTMVIEAADGPPAVSKAAEDLAVDLAKTEVPTHLEEFLKSRPHYKKIQFDELNTHYQRRLKDFDSDTVYQFEDHSVMKLVLGRKGKIIAFHYTLNASKEDFRNETNNRTILNSIFPEKSYHMIDWSSRHNEMLSFSSAYEYTIYNKAVRMEVEKESLLKLAP